MIILYYTSTNTNTILYYTILYYTILYYTILYYTILYYTILHYTILYYTILYYIILYYSILYCFIAYSTTVGVYIEDIYTISLLGTSGYIQYLFFCEGSSEYMVTALDSGEDSGGGGLEKSVLATTCLQDVFADPAAPED